MGYWSRGADEDWFERRLRGGSEESVMITSEGRYHRPAKVQESGQAQRRGEGKGVYGSGERRVDK